MVFLNSYHEESYYEKLRHEKFAVTLNSRAALHAGFGGSPRRRNGVSWYTKYVPKCWRICCLDNAYVSNISVPSARRILFLRHELETDGRGAHRPGRVRRFSVDFLWRDRGKSMRIRRSEDARTSREVTAEEEDTCDAILSEEISRLLEEQPRKASPFPLLCLSPPGASRRERRRPSQ